MDKNKVTMVFLGHIIRPIVYLILILIIYFALQYSNIVSAKILDKTAYILIVFASSYLISKIFGALLRWYLHRMDVKTTGRLESKFLPFADKISIIVICTIAILMTLQHFGQNISAFLATLGFLSLAVALALQEVIANIIAGFVIMLDAPFSVGDKIKLLPSGEIGEIISIGLKSTRLKSSSADVGILVIPNAELARTRIINLSKQ
ncbi:MAG: mechanosensitive ion channel domain-containing protein [Candidatus Firestonebacteria bacterium]